MRENPVKRRLAEGGVSVGAFVFEFSTTGVARIAASAGAEFVFFDQEHTGWSVETVRTLIAAARASDIVPMVRVPATEYHFIARALDAGAMGVMAPMVESEEQARLIVSSAKYPPAGRRGFGLLYSDQIEEGNVVRTMASGNREVLLVAQIETAAGVENVEKIAAVDGIDVLWIGHNDLTSSLGIPGMFTHPDYARAVDRVLAAGRAHGKAVGIMATRPEEGPVHLGRGFRALAYGDIWLYEEALRQGVRAVRAAIADTQG